LLNFQKRKKTTCLLKELTSLFQEVFFHNSSFPISVSSSDLAKKKEKVPIGISFVLIPTKRCELGRGSQKLDLEPRVSHSKLDILAVLRTSVDQLLLCNLGNHPGLGVNNLSMEYCFSETQ
jgi:hypothetical protein